MSEAEVFVVEVPRDAEYDLMRAMDEFHVDASTFVPSEIDVGAIRVSRTGGQLVAEGHRDQVEGLVEVWAENSVDAFDSAIRPWAVLRVVGARGWIVPGIAALGVEIDPPRAMDDPHRQHLYRVQFAFRFQLPLTDHRISIEEDL